MDYTDVVNALYSASRDPQLWSDALCSVVDYVGAVAGNLVYQAPPGGRSFLIPGRMRDDLNTLYLKHYTGNPYARAFEKVEPNQVVIGNHLIDSAAVRRSAFFADICQPQHIFNQLFVPHASLQQPGGIGGVALFLSERQSEEETQAAARLRRLAPHVNRAIDLSLLLGQTNHNNKLLERLLDVMPNAAVLLDARGAIVRTNAAADDLLQKGDGIYAKKTERLSLAAHGHESAARLTASIRNALANDADGPSGFDATLRIERPSGLPPYIVLVTPLPLASFPLWEAVDDGARVLVQIVDLRATRDFHADYLRNMFGLTAAETRVATLVGTGMRIPDIARALGRSAHTIKTHVSRCLSKTGARSQVDLARLLASIPLLQPTPSIGLKAAPDVS